MPSFNQAQSKLLGSGFLNNLGSGPEEGLQLDAAAKVLAELAAEFALNAQANLNKADRVASGDLNDSIIPLPLQIMGKTIIAEVKVLDYYKFINSGVKGTTGGAGKYSFKNSHPSKKMQEAIRKWLITEGIKIRNTKVAVNSREKRRLSFKNVDKTSSLAYAVATNIKKRGLKATKFWDDAERDLRKVIKERLSGALKIDVINSLK